MTSLDVAIQIKSLRAQLDVLEAKLRAEPTRNGHTLADLHGVLAGQADTSPAEIEQSLYRVLGTGQP